MAKILIIEDNSTMGEGMLEILQKEGHLVDLAYQGEQGVILIKRHQYDLIFCDMRLPDMSGLEVLAEHQSSKSKAKFVFITAFGNIELAVECIKKGAYDFIPKPFTPNVLREKVIEYTQKKE
ncbi:MAG TPA: response regulator [Oligoflexia bacterium]|nr:response regulator [Oligoflexia bacterium]HMR24461.1 response regulator [Oligoflexia bacterium]